MGSPNDRKSPPKRIRIEFEKGDNYQEVYAEGAFGGITPSGLIRFMLYNDRGPTPKALHHEIDPDGSLGPEISEKRETNDGFVRDLKIGVTMTPSAAAALAAWLKEKVDLLRTQAREEGEDEPEVS